jgi:biotin synthase
MSTTEALTENDLETWLREADETRLEELWRAADAMRRETVGGEVHLRGLIEISNICCRRCAYCGLRADNQDIRRYRMTREEILECVREAQRYGYGTVVMQAGEDYGITREWLAAIVRTIKEETDLAVTLSMGERPDEDLAAWREAGADRYLLRFETSDPELFALIHPPAPGKAPKDRMEILRKLQELGYEAGSGVMIGIPGQSYATLAHDIATFRDMDLDMIGVGPYIPHEATPLGDGSIHREISPEDQVPATEAMTYKVVALTRLVCPEANIPSTSALATLNTAKGREYGLQRGANVVMPNLTPPQYRALYEIYPAKACINETSAQCHHCMKGRIRNLGRDIGAGQGGRKRHAAM